MELNHFTWQWVIVELIHIDKTLDRLQQYLAHRGMFQCKKNIFCVIGIINIKLRLMQQKLSMTYTNIRLEVKPQSLESIDSPKSPAHQHSLPTSIAHSLWCVWWCFGYMKYAYLWCRSLLFHDGNLVQLMVQFMLDLISRVVIAGFYIGGELIIAHPMKYACIMSC